MTRINKSQKNLVWVSGGLLVIYVTRWVGKHKHSIINNATCDMGDNNDTNHRPSIRTKIKQNNYMFKL